MPLGERFSLSVGSGISSISSRHESYDCLNLLICRQSPSASVGSSASASFSACLSGSVSFCLERSTSFSLCLLIFTSTPLSLSLPECLRPKSLSLSLPPDLTLKKIVHLQLSAFCVFAAAGCQNSLLLLMYWLYHPRVSAPSNSGRITKLCFFSACCVCCLYAFPVLCRAANNLLAVAPLPLSKTHQQTQLGSFEHSYVCSVVFSCLTRRSRCREASPSAQIDRRRQKQFWHFWAWPRMLPFRLHPIHHCYRACLLVHLFTAHLVHQPVYLSHLRANKLIFIGIFLVRYHVIFQLLTARSHPFTYTC